MTNTIMSTFKGSARTRDAVRSQIVARFGQEAGEKYNPYTNCLTYKAWLSAGYKVKPGEKSLRSTTIIERKTPMGTVKFPRSVSLFFIDQVLPINA
jgi:hypothetical protein